MFFRVFRKSYAKKLFKDTENSTELKLVQKLLREKGLHFLDIGCNRGEFVYAALNAVNSHKIWAFEPLPYFSRKLKALFPKVKVFQLALSDENKKTVFYEPVNDGVADDSGSSLNRPEGDFKRYEVLCKTLDAVTRENKFTEKTFLKIDVEGHEFEVMKGGKDFIAKYTEVMLVEIEERHHEGVKQEELIRKAEGDSFTCFYYHTGKARLVKFSEEAGVFQDEKDMNTDKYINNFWFFKKGNAHWAEELNRVIA